MGSTFSFKFSCGSRILDFLAYVEGKCRMFVAFLMFPMLLVILILLVQYPQRVDAIVEDRDGTDGSISRGLEICNNFGAILDAPKIHIPWLMLQPDVVSDLKLEAWGPYDWLRVGQDTRGIWRDVGVTPDYVLQQVNLFGTPITFPSEHPSMGRSQIQMQRMQPKGMLQYMHNLSLHNVSTMILFSSTVGHPATPWSLFESKYQIGILAYLVSAFGATLAYTAQLRCRVQTPLDRFVFWYFTIAVLSNGPGCLGFFDVSCGELAGYNNSNGLELGFSLYFAFMVPGGPLSNLLLQYIMFLKVQDLEAYSLHGQVVRRMALMLKLEWLWLCGIALLFNLGWQLYSTQLGMIAHMSMVTMVFLLLLLADGWFSVLCVKTYFAPLKLVQASLSEQEGTDPETRQQLRKAFSIAMWNLSATVVAVITTSLYYVAVVMFWGFTLIAALSAKEGEGHWLSDEIAWHFWGGPIDMMRIQAVDSVLNDLATMVFADLLFLNFKASIAERRIGWSIGQVGQHAAMKKKQDDEQQAELHRELRALEAGPNPKLRHELAGLEASLQRAILSEYRTGDAREAEQIFAEMQSLATEEMRRLTRLADTILDLYKHASARYEYIEGIRSFGLMLQQHIPKRVLVQEDNGPVMAFLYLQADVIVTRFDDCIAQLVSAFNEAEDATDLGLDPQVFCFKIRARKGQSQAVKLLGPKKTEARGWQKVKNPEDYGNMDFPQAAHLLDIVRAQVKFPEPYALAVFYHYLKSREDVLEVVRVKNRFLEEDSALGYLLVNVRLQDSDYIMELQLTLQNLAEMKSCMHAFYKVLRCPSRSDLVLQTIFCKLYSDNTKDVLIPGATDLQQPPKVKASPPTAVIPCPPPPPQGNPEKPNIPGTVWT